MLVGINVNLGNIGNILQKPEFPNINSIHVYFGNIPNIAIFPNIKHSTLITQLRKDNAIYTLNVKNPSFAGLNVYFPNFGEIECIPP